MRVPRPLGSCHQCWTSPSTNWWRGRAQQVLAREVGAGERQRHRVLELVAEAERPARLVVAGARPQPAAQVLVEQPAVHQQVEGVVRRAHLHRVERPVPGAAHGAERRRRPPRREPWRATSARACRGVRAPGPAGTRSARVSPGARADRELQRGAGIEARAEAPGERLARERRRPRERPVAAQERGPVARGRAERARSRGRRPRARRTRCCRDCARGSHPSQGRARSRRGAPGPRAAGPGSTRCRRRRSGGAGRRSSFVSVSRESFTGSLASTNTSSSWRRPCATCEKRLQPAECRTRTRLVAVRRSGPTVGDQASPVSSSRTKSASAVGSLTGSFANGVSRFSRLLPAQVKAEPGSGDHGAEPGVGDHVRPRQRRFRLSLEHAPRSLARASAKPPRPLRQRERRRLEARAARRPGARRSRGHELGRLRLGPVGVGVLELRLQVAAVAAQHGARHGREQDALGVAHAVAAQQVGPAGLVVPRPPRAVVEERRELAVHLVEIARRGARSGSRRRRAAP